MRVYEILTESQDLAEGPLLNKFGTAVGKGVGTAAKAAGAVAGGAVGAFQALKKGYQAGKGVVGQAGDDETSTSTSTNKTPAAPKIEPTMAPTGSAPAKVYPAAQAKKDADTLVQNVAKVRNRDRQAVVDYVKGKLDSVVKAAPAATSTAKPAVAAPAKTTGVKIPASKPAVKKPAVKPAAV